jgi:hypothetical protein
MRARAPRRFARLALLVLCLPTLFVLGDAARDPAPSPGRAVCGDDVVGEILADGFWDAAFPDGPGGEIDD